MESEYQSRLHLVLAEDAVHPIQPRRCAFDSSDQFIFDTKGSYIHHAEVQYPQPHTQDSIPLRHLSLSYHEY